MTVGEPSAATDLLAGRLLRSTHRLHQALRARLGEPVRQAGLTLPQWLMLCHLRQHPLDTLSGIAASVAHDAGMLSRAIRDMQAMGLVASERHARDQRRLAIALTEAGKALHDSMHHALPPPTELLADGGRIDVDVHALMEMMDRCAAALR